MPSKLVILLILNYHTVLAALPLNLRYPLPSVINKITEVNASCDAGSINITVTLKHPFKGTIFAKDFSQECRTIGMLTNKLTLYLPTAGCGVRLASEANAGDHMLYSVSLIVQQDRHLKQIVDQEHVVKCKLEDSALTVTSRQMAVVLKNEMMGRGERRTGRMKEGWSKEYAEDLEIGREVIDALSSARAWMEIVPAQDKIHPDSLEVGEPALLMLKATLPAEIGWKVVDCVATDGLGDSSQKLLDEYGCPIDELLLPAPLLGPPRSMALMRYQEAVSRFAAFKFPDRDRLHLSCGLQLCRGICQKVDCRNESSFSDNRLPRTLSKGVQGEILDRFEVFNSVEVLAPGIELDEWPAGRERYSSSDTFTSPFANLPGDRTFCVSPEKMAIAFAVLGVIFLCAVIVSVSALMWGRRSHNGRGIPYYSRSLFSSSSSGSGYGGSKLLLHESPCGQSSARSFAYGRVI